jgi:hypothetical protein
VTTIGHDAELPASSFAVAVTVEIPAAKIDPDAGVAKTVVLEEQVSDAVVVKVTGAPHAPAEAGTSIGAGQEIAGGV